MCTPDHLGRVLIFFTDIDENTYICYVWVSFCALWKEKILSMLR